MTDPIIHQVCEKLILRSRAGIEKYGTTLKDNTADNYLKHLQEELMDATNYIETLLQQHQDITQIVSSEPNDVELGSGLGLFMGNG